MRLSARMRAAGVGGAVTSLLIGVTVAGAMQGGSAGAALPASETSWRLVLHDDFDSLDTTRWGVYGDGDPAKRRQANHVRVWDGKLVIKSYRERDGHWYTGGVGHDFAQRYGKYEVRLRVDKASGVEAGALLWPQGGRWPHDGSVGFFKVSDPERRRSTPTAHYVAGPLHRTKTAEVAADYTEWQTVGVEWTPGKLVYTLNGRPAGEVTGAAVPDKAMFLALQGALTAPTPTAAQDVIRYEIDWVKVYSAQSGGTPRPTPTNPTPGPTVTPTPTGPPTNTTGWRVVYRNEFTDLRDVSVMHSSASLNSQVVNSGATNNGSLQKPTVRDNVTIGSDARAGDGKAMGVYTRRASFATQGGSQVGWTNGRMQIKGQDQAPPVRIRTRLRMTPSIGVKAAVMWWPAGGGWPWEVDFAETFGGETLTDKWGSRQLVAQRWHGDVNGDGQAREQIFHDDRIDATEYHVYDLTITPHKMSVAIDGQTTFSTTDKNFIPDGPGYFAVGKALTGTRNGPRSDDAVHVDWVEVLKPTS